MHVRKFEGDTLDDVIGQVKKELGPDAIILKTKTNRVFIGYLCTKIS
jgi:flagellar biosynthesis GTPase FlhF